MAQDYLSLSSPTFPFRLLLGASALSSVLVVAPCSWFWASDDSAGSFDPTNPLTNTAVNLYDTTTILDTTQYTWILLAVKGSARPAVAKEVDFSTFDTLAGSNWAILGRVAGGILYPIPGI